MKLPRLKTSFLLLALALGAPLLASAQDYTMRVSVKTLVVDGAAGAGQDLGSLGVELSASTPPEALVGKAYSYNLNTLLTVTGDSTYNGSGVTWGLVDSTLPEGLYLTSDGYIGGTPTAPGQGSVKVRASYKGANGEQPYQVIALDISMSLVSATLPAAGVGSPYSYDFTSLVSSNDPTFTGVRASFSATGLPAGLSMAPNGVLSGTPTVKNEAGASFQVLASYKGKDGQQVYTVN